jgi:hypothetical protein
MDKYHMLATLDSLSAEHGIIAEEVKIVKIAIKNHSESARADILKLNRELKHHFFREDIELFPIVMKVFCPPKEKRAGVSMFETEEEKTIREQNCLSDEQKRALWASEYDDRDARSELISFAKITLQVFEIIDGYLQSKPENRDTANAKMMGEVELFPKVRQMIRLGH